MGLSMSCEIIPRQQGSSLTVPAIIADAGDGAARRSLEFFTVNIRAQRQALTAH